jgi:hypothetical protein
MENLLSSHLPNFPLNSTGSVLSEACTAQGFQTYHDLAQYIRALPYGRTSEPENLVSVLTEHRGTCSLKHALLAAIAQELKQPIELTMGIYKMHSGNTPAISHLLQERGIEFIPEAHCYLTYNGERFDFTRATQSITPKERFTHECSLIPSNVAAEKKRKHQEYLQKWLKESGLSLSFQELWQLREVCIAALRDES